MRMSPFVLSLAACACLGLAVAIGSDPKRGAVALFGSLSGLLFVTGLSRTDWK